MPCSFNKARKGNLNEYEVRLKYVGCGKKPDYVDSDYGFGTNPPIVVRAKTKSNALRQLKLPSTVKVKSIRKTS